MSSPTLPFSLEEFRNRITRVRTAMDERNLDALLVTTPENIYYLTGYSTPAYYSTQALVLPLKGEPFLFTYVVDMDVVRRCSWVSEFAAYGPTDRPISKLAAAVRDRGLGSGRLGLEMSSWFFSVASFRELCSELKSLEIVDASGLVEAHRAFKSQAEIAYIREGAKVASASMHAVLKEISDGGNENDLAAAAYAGGIRNGGEFPGSPPYVSAGPRVLIPHASWNQRALQKGDQVFIELSGCVKRYSGALMRTFFLGDKVPEVIERLEEAIISGLNAAIERLRPGSLSGEVDAACRGAVAAAGFSYDHESGYSIGVCYPPGWNETHVFNLKPEDQRVIQPNMTFHLVPHVIIPDVGAVGLSETVLVTENGPEVLTDFPRRMIRI